MDVEREKWRIVWLKLYNVLHIHRCREGEVTYCMVKTVECTIHTYIHGCREGEVTYCMVKTVECTIHTYMDVERENWRSVWLKLHKVLCIHTWKQSWRSDKLHDKNCRMYYTWIHGCREGEVTNCMVKTVECTIQKHMDAKIEKWCAVWLKLQKVLYINIFGCMIDTS